jgi:putative thioredoxin
MTEQPIVHDLVFDVGEADFQEQVLRRSLDVPVVVDFWAAWCGPCRVLGPILEEAVEARGGSVLLARVDVDQNQRLAAAFGIQGIPAVKAFMGGQLVDEFIGAQPPAVVERFLDALAPSPAEVAAAEAAALDPARAATRYAEMLAADPDSVPARVGLAGLALDRGDVAEALDLLKPVEHAPEAATVLARARLVREGADAASPFAEAARMASDGAPEAALDQLLGAVRHGGERREPARRLMLDVFRILGDDDPLTARFRRDLASALF